MKVKKAIPVFTIIVVVFLINSCEKDALTGDAPFELNIPKGFSQPQIPEDNKLTVNRVELGKRLFFDPILSKDSTVSCASCHKTEFAFADNVAISEGVEGEMGFRNSISLLNVAYQPHLFMDGGVPDLEGQVIAPINGEDELGSSLVEVLEKLNNHPEYPQLFEEAYKRKPDGFSLVRAISAFERTLISGNSKYDRFKNGNEQALNESEKKGMELFFSDKTNCSKCHTDFMFTNFQFENNGLYQNYADSGRARVTLNSADAGKFKVPSLRNIELTAPYMHDGNFTSLSQVIDHYISGGENHPNKNKLIKGFVLSAEEKKDLIAFLEALTSQG